MRLTIGFEEPRFCGRVEQRCTRGGVVIDADQKLLEVRG